VSSREICGVPPEVGGDGRARTHSVRETRPDRRSMNSERIVQHRTHIHTLNPFTREETIKHDCELGDANERNPTVRSVTLWRFNCRDECT
jgi:hypothetical protein